MSVHYRQLVVWQKAMVAARLTYGLARVLPREKAYGMRSQLTRAVVSIPANIAEGWARESDGETAHFLSIAQGSLAESDTLLTICEDIGWFNQSDTAEVRSLHDEVGRMLTVLRRNLRASLAEKK